MQRLFDILRRPARRRTESEVRELMNEPSSRELADLMPVDETVMRVAKGEHNGYIGVMAATDKRMLFVSKGALSYRVYEIPYDAILGVRHKTRGFLSRIAFTHIDGEFMLNKVTRHHAKQFIAFINDKLSSQAPVLQQ